jgi:DEAD/DEAH box helicase domain-containing protein
LLGQRGITQLYSHQTEAIEAVLDGQSVVIVTSTASGKTFCYHLPTLHHFLSDPNSRALYLFPTKALTRDQAAGYTTFAPDVPVFVYDGDTPQNQRTVIRSKPGIVLSNPDMLHVGIVPAHTKWAEFFSALKVVVIDELHTYRGVFGSHVANVIRRLQRICQFYGSSPLFVCASATIGNPGELAERLVGRSFTVIDHDGAPKGEKQVILVNPPLLDQETGVRRSYLLEAKRVAAEFIEAGVQTLVFARARNTTEVLLGYLQDALKDRIPKAANSIRGYRGGYLPTERRNIEVGLRTGGIRAVVTTNALELGIDIGQLGAAVIAGYPGTLASTWQQIGRAGRRYGQGLSGAAVIVLSGSPLEQYLALHPRYLFDTRIEQARINPDNPVILLGHLRCAAYELPFKIGESFGTLDDVTFLLDHLADHEGLLSKGTETYRWIAPQPPAPTISLRTGTNTPILIQEVMKGSPVMIGQVDRETAPRLVHPNAIYLHEGRQYLIDSLDWENGVANASITQVDYYTEPISTGAVEVIAETESKGIGGVRVGRGSVEVREQVIGYRMIKRYSHELMGVSDLDMPEQRYETTAYWIALTPDLAADLEQSGLIVKPNDYGPNWGKQRDLARARDGYQCLLCGALESPGQQHHVHHVLPFHTFGYVRGQNTTYLEANQLGNLQTLCPSCHRKAETSERSSAALFSAGAALQSVATLRLMCEPSDLGLSVETRHSYTHAPTLMLHDQLPAGLGFSEKLYELHDELLKGALELIQDCPCAEGCPACIGGMVKVGKNVKAGALYILSAIQGG